MKYLLIINMLLVMACGTEKPAARPQAVADKQTTLGLLAAAPMSGKQSYRLVVCDKGTSKCHDALQTKDGREVRFVYDPQAQHLVSDSETGAVVAIKHLPAALATTNKRGVQRRQLVMIPVIVAGVAIGILAVQLRRPVRTIVLTNKTKGQEQLWEGTVKEGQQWLAGDITGTKTFLGAIGGAFAAAGVTMIIEPYLWGYGERQAVRYWNDIFSSADHKQAVAVKDVDSIVQALAETFDLVKKPNNF